MKGWMIDQHGWIHKGPCSKHDCQLWVRNPDNGVVCKWRTADRYWNQWADIDAVRVLSPGWSP